MTDEKHTRQGSSVPTLAAHLSEVMNHRDTPAELFNAIADALGTMSGRALNHYSLEFLAATLTDGTTPGDRARKAVSDPPLADAITGSSGLGTSKAPQPQGRGAEEDGVAGYSVEIPLYLRTRVGLNRAERSAHEVKEWGATRAADICASLFWVVEQLGELANAEPWVFDRDDLHAALVSIGEVGSAVAVGASEQAQSIAHVARGLYEESKGVSDESRD